jgi:starch synthase
MDPYQLFEKLEVSICLKNLYTPMVFHLVLTLKGVLSIIAGLYDTVFDVDNDKDRAQAQGLEPNGFSFEGADTNGVDYALGRQVKPIKCSINSSTLTLLIPCVIVNFRAITTFYDARDWFNSLCKRVMEQDWSWNRPALDYMELYHSARKN